MWVSEGKLVITFPSHLLTGFNGSFGGLTLRNGVSIIFLKSEGDAMSAGQQRDESTSKSARPRSGVQFPYSALESAIKVADVIYHDAGGSCSREQLAPMLGYAGTKNGGFLSRLGAARMFGLVEEVAGMIRPTALATKIIAPIETGDLERGLVDAFLNVELFEKLHERYKGQPLPNQQGLENLLRNELKVVPAQVKNAIRVFFESAEVAGFFSAAGRGRLVLPLVANGKPPQLPPAPLPRLPQPLSDTPTGLPLGGVPLSHGSAQPQGVSEMDRGIPQAIYGLLRDLPPAGTRMAAARRARLVKAFEASVMWLYPGEEDEEESR